MIHSMTGFGDASEQVDGVHYAVEIRSLNNRYFKSTIRLPEEIGGLEAELESLLRKRLTRGSVTLSVNMRVSGAMAAQRVDDDVLLSYLEHLETIHTKFTKQDRAVQIDLTALLAMPGVLQPSVNQREIFDQSRPVVTKLVNQACDNVIQMRITEGKGIAADFATQSGVIQDRLDLIKGRAPKVVEEYHQRLRTRIDELISRAKLKMDENDLIREVAIFAERADISEETSRMGGHLEQFRKLVNGESGGPVGRTLDFMTQELLREANTIASKSNDVEISRAVVEVKGAIDRIKEQAQNVE